MAITNCLLIRSLVVLAACLQPVPAVYANDSSADEHFFVVLNGALDEQGRAARSLAEKRTNAEAARLLALKAAGVTNLSNTVQLSLWASAVEGYNRYVQGMLGSSNDLERFAASPDGPAAVEVLTGGLELDKRVPFRPAFLSVMPPIWTPGVTASGMDPKGIEDPKARAEYERRIEENRQAGEEDNCKIRLERSLELLENSLGWVVTSLARTGKEEPLKTLIMASKLPDEIKKQLMEPKDKRNNSPPSNAGTLSK